MLFFFLDNCLSYVACVICVFDIDNLVDNLGRGIGASEMHLSPPVAWAAVRSKGVVLLLLTFCLLLLPLWESVIVLCCCTLLCVHFSIAIILMGKRELIALLNLSSWCHVMVERLFLGVPRVCLQFVIVVFPDHTHFLFLVRVFYLLLFSILKSFGHG